MEIQSRKKSPATRDRRHRRLGSILVLSAFMLVVVFAFLSFTVDVGFIALTKTQLQSGSDAASLSATLDLYEAIGPGATKSSAEAEWEARQTAVDIAALHRAGDLPSISADSQEDVRLGLYQWDPSSGSYVEMWGVQPYNMVEVTLHRDQASSDDDTNSSNDGPLPLFFSPVIGHETADVQAQAVAAMLPGVGFRATPLNAPVVPLALDEMTWNDLLNGIGPDEYDYDPDSGAISSGSDGVLEANLYPIGSTELPPGNRGTVDLGSSDNSTSDIERQILHGLNETDLSYFPNSEIHFGNGPIDIQGDTGISAGFKDELDAIKGEAIAIPIFSEVTGPGNNAVFTIVKFVGVRILDVKLTGSPSKKHVTIQPAPFMHSSVIAAESGTTVTSDSIFSPPKLIR